MPSVRKPHQFKNHNNFNQIFIGLFIGTAGSLLQRLLGNTFEHTHYIFLFQAVALDSYYGGGLVSGATATLITSITSTISLSQEHLFGHSNVKYLLPIAIYFLL
jgi:hypothetical protein